MASIWGELKRRNVVKVAVAYAIVAWLLMQVVSTFFPALNLPEWTITFVAALLLIGLPMALLLAWAFELTPDGIRPTTSVESASSITSITGRKIDFVIIGLLVLATGFMFFDKYLPSDTGDEIVHQDTPAAPEVTSEQAPAPAIEEQRDIMPNSVAVLPFDNLSPDPDNAFFAAGIHDEVLNQLVKIEDLTVIARTSVLGYQDSGKSIAEIAEELNVESVMEGTVRFSGDRVRITAQLIDPATGGHLWSETYEHPFDTENIFTIESDIAVNVATALEAELLPGVRAHIEKFPTTSPEAYAAYLRAIDIYPGLTSSGLMGSQFDEASALLEQATEIDPEFALAWAHRSKGRLYVVDEGLEYVQRALELDPELGFGYLVLASHHFAAGEAPEARQAFERALQFSPNDPNVLTEYAQFKWITGQRDDFEALASRVIDLDPNNWGTHFAVGELHRLAGDHAAAAAAFRRSAELNPSNIAVHSELGLDLAALGDEAGALEKFRIVEEVMVDPRFYDSARLAYNYGRVGQTEDAQRYFDNYESLLSEWLGQPGRDGAAVYMAAAFANLGIGNNEKAVEALEMLAETNSKLTIRVHEFAVNSWKDPVLDQPEFAEVRERLLYREP